MNQPATTPKWRKSSYSNGTGGECVEIADLQSAVGVRDSKQPRGPRISVHHSAWARFVASLRAS
ncbi:DUF397 domain-containing protein [Streptomyces sp. NBC_01768]|uniref:DUF397 domain-containing protein n=1 Tax=Streptomyces sp. NBC_01768 TaxID=2975938 RepID=UPI002DDB067A|nr:DUF397 domain-containing protein [Streptomyces sp. NBC_01768]WSC33391.1 DUF397 domain-containing protein [Streptomyces sp. NBC_01768]